MRQPTGWIHIIVLALNVSDILTIQIFTNENIFQRNDVTKYYLAQFGGKYQNQQNAVSCSSQHFRDIGILNI